MTWPQTHAFNGNNSLGPNSPPNHPPSSPLDSGHISWGLRLASTFSTPPVLAMLSWLQSWDCRDLRAIQEIFWDWQEVDKRAKFEVR